MKGPDPGESIEIIPGNKEKIRGRALHELFRQPLRIIGFPDSGGIDHLVIGMLFPEFRDCLIQYPVVIAVFYIPVASGKNTDHDFFLPVKSPFAVYSAEEDPGDQD